MIEKGIKTFQPKNRAEWRAWLEKNHVSENSVWLIYYKMNAGFPTISYSDAVDEALCFGWIDSKAKSIDNLSYKQFFSKRKPNSVWSKVNKDKAAKLIEQGLMTEAGYKSIEIAKQNGSWTILDEAEALIIPTDLKVKLDQNSRAKAYFESLSRTDKRNLLQWLVSAKRQETRQKRIDELVALAEQQKKPKQF